VVQQGVEFWTQVLARLCKKVADREGNRILEIDRSQTSRRKLLIGRVLRMLLAARRRRERRFLTQYSCILQNRAKYWISA
jgi:hypothetical protein